MTTVWQDRTVRSRKCRVGLKTPAQSPSLYWVLIIEQRADSANTRDDYGRDNDYYNGIN